MPEGIISRRDFLKLAGAGAVGAAAIKVTRVLFGSSEPDTSYEGQAVVLYHTDQQERGSPNERLIPPEEKSRLVRLNMSPNTARGRDSSSFPGSGYILYEDSENNVGPKYLVIMVVEHEGEEMGKNWGMIDMVFPYATGGISRITVDSTIDAPDIHGNILKPRQPEDYSFKEITETSVIDSKNPQNNILRPLRLLIIQKPDVLPAGASSQVISGGARLPQVFFEDLPHDTPIITSGFAGLLKTGPPQFTRQLFDKMSDPSADQSAPGMSFGLLTGENGKLLTTYGMSGGPAWRESDGAFVGVVRGSGGDKGDQTTIILARNWLPSIIDRLKSSIPIQ